MLSRHSGRIRRISMKRSLARSKLPETQGRILGFQHFPGSARFQALGTGSQVKMVANSNAVFVQRTKTMPKYTQYVTVVKAQKMRRNSIRNVILIVQERIWNIYFTTVKYCKHLSVQCRVPMYELVYLQ